MNISLKASHEPPTKALQEKLVNFLLYRETRMEGPTSSFVNNNFECNEAANDHNDAPEESGWTTYLEDFSMNQRENSSCSDEDESFGSPSLLSDAASHAAWKNNCNTNNQVAIGGSVPFLKRLNLKKKRNKKISDPDLEDTASSPVNSPKVSSFKQMDINYRTENSSGNFMGNEGRFGQFQEMHTDGRNSNTSLDGKKNGYIDLKKKGLCVLPWSMIVNNQG